MGYDDGVVARRALLLALSFLSSASIAVVACLGDDPVVTPPPATDGGATGRDSAPGVEAGNDSSATDPCTGDGGPAGLAFVTSSAHAGDLGGVAGADKICLDSARDAGLSQNFRAWIADTTTSPVDRIVTPAPLRPVRLVSAGGPQVVACATRLTLGGIDAPINQTETGATLASNESVWTGTGNKGEIHTDGEHCDGFTSKSSSLRGRIGSTSATNGQWTNAEPAPCDKLRRLFCFEVP